MERMLSHVSLTALFFAVIILYACLQFNDDKAEYPCAML